MVCSFFVDMGCDVVSPAMSCLLKSTAKTKLAAATLQCNPDWLSDQAHSLLMELASFITMYCYVYLLKNRAGCAPRCHRVLHSGVHATGSATPWPAAQARATRMARCIMFACGGRCRHDVQCGPDCLEAGGPICPPACNRGGPRHARHVRLLPSAPRAAHLWSSSARPLTNSERCSSALSTGMCCQPLWSARWLRVCCSSMACPSIHCLPAKTDGLTKGALRWCIPIGRACMGARYAHDVAQNVTVPVSIHAAGATTQVPAPCPSRSNVATLECSHGC